MAEGAAPVPAADPARQPADDRLPASCRGGAPAATRSTACRCRRSAGIGLEGPGIVIFGAAIAALVLLDIGYMRGRWGFILDAPWVYLRPRPGRGGGARLPGLGAVVGRLPPAAAAVARAGAGGGRGGAGAVRRRLGVRVARRS